MNRSPITRQRSAWATIDDCPVPGGSAFIRRVGDGWLRAIVAEELPGWHLSISWAGNSERQALRYPTWDEIAHARDELLPATVEFVMILPRAGEYVAVHETTFHLHEHPERTRS